MQEMKLKISILSYQISTPTLIRAFWLLLAMIFGMMKAKENNYLMGFLFLFGTALILQVVLFYDVLKIESYHQNFKKYADHHW
jgi:hypothetical protein